MPRLPERSNRGQVCLCTCWCQSGGSTVRWHKLPLTLPTKWLEKSWIIQNVYLCVYHKERGGSKGKCLRLPLHACMHVFLLLMSARVCHGWASVQTKAPQRTEARVINLSDRQDPQRLYLAPLLSGKPWHTVSCWDLTSAVWLAHSKAFPSTSCAPDCPGTHGPLCSESPSPIVA